jgi:hypothetical protein
MHLFFIITALFLVTAQPAAAYLDPGTGSLILQGLIATASTALVFISLGWQSVKHTIARLLGRISPPKDEAKKDDTTE